MATALHPKTLLALDFAGKSLAVEYGFPLRLRVPTKLRFKNARHIAAIFVSDTNPGGYRKVRATTGLAVFSARTAPVPRNRAALTARDGDRTIKPQKRQAYRPCKIA